MHLLTILFDSVLTIQFEPASLNEIRAEFCKYLLAIRASQ